MGATPTQTGIVNRAAALLGSTARISSITQVAPLAQHALAHWDEVLRELLAEHPWNFAIKRTEISAAAEAPPFGYDNRFALPADCIRWLPPSQEEADWFEAVEEGNHLLTNAEAPLPVRYISSDLGYDLVRWPPHFATAMAYALAEMLAEPVTQSETLKSDMRDDAAVKLRLAKRRDGQASGNIRRSVVTAKSDWLSARVTPYYFHGR